MYKQKPSPDLSIRAEQSLTDYEHYLRHEQDLRQLTIRDYLSDLRLFMAWCERDWAKEVNPLEFIPQHVATPTIIRYRDYLQGDLKRKPATINRYLMSIKRYFSRALSQKLIARDPSIVVKMIAETTRPPSHMTDLEENRLITAVTEGRSLRDRALIITMLHTGLRLGEVCKLKWHDLVIGERSGYVKVTGKGNKYREVPLNVTVRNAIREYQENLDLESEYVFISQKTRKNLTRRGVSFAIKKYARKAGIPDLKPHDLRHRFGYRMAVNVPIHRLAQIMGHDSLDTTMIYIRGTPGDLQQAVESIAWE